MANYIVKATKTYLKSPLTASATTLLLRYLKDSKGNNLSMADFGDWGVVVIKQGDRIEMIKFDGLTVNADNTVTLDVETDGRALDPTTPYAGSSSGLSFQTGAEVIVTNDPLTVSQYVRTENDNTFTGLQTFTQIPVLPAEDPTTDNEAARKSYVDDQVALKVALTGNETVAGIKTFTSSPIVPTPTTDYQAATKKYIDDNSVFLTGNQTVAGIKTYTSSPIVPTPTTDFQAATKKYVDDTAFAGAPDADNATKGIVEIATEAEVIAGTSTGGTGAALVIPASLGDRLPSADEKGALAAANSPSAGNPFATQSDLSAGASMTLYSNVFGGSTTQFDITDQGGDTFRYTYDSTGTDPNISATTVPVGTVLVIAGQNFNANNNGAFVVTGSGANYFEVTNASGVAESNKTLGSGSIKYGFQKSALTKYVVVEVIGGGGAGGGVNDNVKAAGGGGAGSYAKIVIEAADLGATETITVGAGGVAVSASTGGTGGTSSFGSHIVAAGGAGGGGGSSASNGGGAGGTASAGTLKVPGQAGGSGTTSGSSTASAGYGGNSHFGYGPQGGTSTGKFDGGVGTGYGAGGSGGGCGSGASGTTTGGNGGGGFVIVYEY